MKLSSFAVFACFLLVMGKGLLAQTPMDKYLSKIAIFEGGEGRKLETYEDVDPIVFNPFQERNKAYPIVNESKIPTDYVDKKTAERYFKLFANHPVFSEEDLTFEDFMNDHFFMTDGNDEINYFPYEMSMTSKPSEFKYYLLMDDEYKYVKSFKKKFAPDSLSCRDCRELCSSKCKRESKTKTTYKIRRGRWGYYYIPVDKVETKKKHVYGENNIYSAFKDTLLLPAHSFIDYATRVDSNKNYVNIVLKDRTPPIIEHRYNQGEAETELRDLGGDLSLYSCTTGDWYEIASITFLDDTKSDFEVKLTFGRISECPSPERLWTDYERWDNAENIAKIHYDQPLKYLVKFDNDRAGIIRYSLFIRDSNGNTNPSCCLVPDRPEICYGYTSREDLGRDPFSAKDWPDKRPLDEIFEKGCETGNLRVYDNDCPNILIRITNTETGEQLFYPPCFPAKKFKVINSSAYKSSYGIGNTNQDDYDIFVGEKLNPEYNHELLFENPNQKSNFTIYKAEDRYMAAKNEEGALNRLLCNNDIKFINENIRLEDYFYSDKKSDGTFDNRLSNGNFGKRHGTLSEMVVLYENTGSFRFKKDVKYKLDIWTDDNVKWTNIKQNLNLAAAYLKDSRVAIEGDEIIGYKAEILKHPEVYPTGITSGTIFANFPNEHEPHDIKIKIDTNKSVNGDITFVFKDKTAPIYSFEKVEALDEYNFPYVQAIVQDNEGWTRNLKLYFRVDDQGPGIRAIDGK